MSYKLKLLRPGVRIKRYLIYLGFGMFFFGLGIGMLLMEMKIQFQIPELYKMFLIGAGLIMVVYGVYKTFNSIIRLLMPASKDIAGEIYKSSVLTRGPKITVIGGGTGLSSILRGLKKYTSNLTAVVTVTDDGGSTGLLRKEYNLPAMGDIRNCIVALSERESLLESLFQYRFDKTEFKGHNFGNLFLTAMYEISNDFGESVKQLSEVLAVKGKVYPSTIENVMLGAEFEDNEKEYGETKISSARKKIKKVFLSEENPPAYPPALSAIKKSDIIILGPGSLYTSVIPNLLIKEIQKEISKKKIVIYIANIMTQPGETENYNLADHISSIYNHAHIKIHYIIANSQPADKKLLQKYIKDNSEQVPLNIEKISDYKIKLIAGNFITGNEFIRHNPEKIARKVMELYYKAV